MGGEGVLSVSLKIGIVLRLTNTNVIFLVSVLLQATFATTGVAAPIRVTITSDSLSFVVPILAQQKGLYRDEGLEVELIRARSQVTVVALKSGEIDYTASLGTAFRAALSGFAFKVVSVSATAPVQQLVVDSSVSKITDLRGKILGIEQPGGSAWYLPKKVLKHFGLDAEKEIRVLSVGNSGDRYASLLSGKIQAAFIPPPFSVQAEARGLRILLNLHEVIQQPFVGLATSLNKIQQSRGQVDAMLRAQNRAVSFIQKRPSETVEFISSYYKLDRAIALRSYELIKDYFSPDGRAPRKDWETYLLEESSLVGLDKPIALRNVVEEALAVK